MRVPSQLVRESRDSRVLNETGAERPLFCSLRSAIQQTSHVNSLVWLDHTNGQLAWQNQIDWAAGLDGSLTYNVDAAFTVLWDDTAWRLPSTVDGPYDHRYDGTTTAGYNITNSESISGKFQEEPPIHGSMRHMPGMRRNAMTIRPCRRFRSADAAGDAGDSI